MLCTNEIKCNTSHKKGRIMDKVNLGKPSKTVEIRGKQIDVAMLTGTLRIFQDRKKITYHNISSITGLGVNSVSAIMENICESDGKKLKLIADAVIGKDVNLVLDVLSLAHRKHTSRNLLTKVIKFCDKRWDKCNLD